MHSTKLQQIIRLELDVAGMRGQVRRGDIAELIYSKFRDELFAEADRREAFVRHINSGVVDAMREPMTEDYLLTHLSQIPRQFLPLLSKLPKWICVNTSGLHAMSIRATPEDWAANARIKRGIGLSVIVKADHSEDVQRLLSLEGAGSIAELGTRIAA